MKNRIVVWVIILGCAFAVLIFSQSGETKPRWKAWNTPSRIAVQQANQPPAKAYQYQPDMAKFMQNMAPLPDKVYETNRLYLEKWQQETGQTPQVVLEGITFNRLTRLRVAEKADVFVLLQPMDMYSAKLGYYSTDGLSLWERIIDLKQFDMNFADGFLNIQISQTGSRIAVYGFQWETAFLIKVFDDQGNEIPTDGRFHHMAPSGNYFYGVDEEYMAPEIVIYDKDLNRLDLKIADLYIKYPLAEQTSVSYRIFNEDYLVVIVNEYVLEKKSIQKNYKSRHRNKFKIFKKTFIIYSLKDKLIVYKKEFYPTTFIKFSNNLCGMTPNWFVASLVENKKRKIFFFNIKSHETYYIKNKSYIYTSLFDDFILLKRPKGKRTSDIELSINFFDIPKKEFKYSFLFQKGITPRNFRLFNSNIIIKSAITPFYFEILKLNKMGKILSHYFGDANLKSLNIICFLNWKLVKIKENLGEKNE